MNDNARANRWLGVLWASVDLVLLVAVAAFGFGLGGSAAYPHVVPGAMGTQLARDAGLVMDLSPLHPLWSVLVQWVVGLGASGEALWRLHWMGKLALAVSALCLFRAVFGLLRGLEGHIAEGPALHPILLRVGALLSVVLLMAPVVREAALTPHSGLLCVVFASLSSLLAVYQIEGRGRWASMAFGVVAGVGILESPGFMMVLPFWVVTVALADAAESTDDSPEPTRFAAFWRFWKSVWATAPVGIFVTIVVAGILLTGYRYYLSGAGEYRYAEGYLDCVLLLLRELTGQWKEVFPARGLLSILMGVYLPAFVAIRFSPWFYGEKPNVFMLVMVSCMGLMGSTMLFPESFFYVARFYSSAEMEVAACFLTAIFGAISFAYLCQSGVHALLWLCFREKDVEVSRWAKARGVLEVLVALGVVGVIGARAGLGSTAKEPEGDRDARVRIGEHVQRMVRDMGETRYLLTNGYWDDLVRLEGVFSGRDVVPLAYTSAGMMQERKRVGEVLESLVERQDYTIGFQNLMMGWKAEHPERFGEASAMVAGFLWERLGMVVVPTGSVMEVLPKEEAGKVDVEARMEALRPVWEAWRGYDVRGVTRRELRQAVMRVRQDVAMVANELGLLAEEGGATNVAVEAFSAAAMVDPVNLPARANLERLGGGEDPEQVHAEVQFFARHYAKRHPELLMLLQGRYAVPKRALTREDMLQEIFREGSVAQLLQASSEPAANLLMGLFRKERNAAQHVRRMLAPEIKNVGNENPTLWLLWGWCGLILEQEKDVAEARWHLRGSRVDGARLEILEAMHAGSAVDVAERMEVMLSMRPQDPAVLRSTIVSSMMAGDFDAGFRAATALLQQAPQDTQALFVVGTHWLLQGKSDVAYAYLKRSEAAGGSSATLLNNLAEAALAQGEPDAALQYARRAHAALPQNSEILETLKKVEAAHAAQAPHAE